MTPPLIGITTYARDKENEFHLPAEYVEAIERANGSPVLIPHGRLGARHWIDRCDGLILAGGGDLDPELYGGESHESIYMVDGERDRSETALILEALRQELPVLAICRGIQVLNVALGGSLYPHLPDIVGDTIKHRLPPRLPTPHPVTVRPGTLLSDVLSCPDCSPVSWHHQAIQTPADSLEVVAHAPDGTIEAVEMPLHPWLIGVQWHPELSAAQDPAQQSLFDRLVEAACDEGGGA